MTIFSWIITKTASLLNNKIGGYKQMERIKITIFMQRTLISTIIHFSQNNAGSSYKQTKWKKPKKEKEKKAQEKGMNQLCSQRYSASFSSPRSLPFLLWLSFISLPYKISQNKNLHPPHVTMLIDLPIDHLHWNPANSCFLPSFQQ